MPSGDDEWDEERIDIIGVNGNDGLHYDDVGSATLVHDNDD